MLTRRAALAAAAAGLGAAAIGSPFSRAMASNLTPKKGGMSVAVVVGDNANVVDFAGPWEVFQDTGNGTQAGFSLYMVSDTMKPLRTTGGMILTPHHDFSTAPQPDIVFMGAQREHTHDKIEWIRHASKKADVVISNCTGAFLLAKTGLLDGLSATTHHDYYDKFQAQFPKVKLVRGPRYVEEGAIMTGGGLSSGIEVALRTVERYYGAQEAARTAFYMEYNRSDHRPLA